MSIWNDQTQRAAAAGRPGDRVIDRRAFIGSLAGGLLAAPLAAEGQQGVKIIFRIGWINTASPGWHDGAFQDGLRELGYVEGRNIITEWRWVEGNFDRLPGIASELVNLKV
ncbi:MAG TPA: hypothetical protein VF104_04105, partial [Burkholderiales bacterium]